MKAVRNFPFDDKPLATLFSDKKELKLVSPASGEHFNPTIFNQFYAVEKNQSWLFYDQKKNLIGHIGLIQTSERTPFLCHLYVIPKLRGTGVAQKLVQFLEFNLLENGHNEVFLSVERKNLRAQRFYQKLKFSLVESSERRDTYRKSLI